jgi:hypothetical protein
MPTPHWSVRGHFTVKYAAELHDFVSAAIGVTHEDQPSTGERLEQGGRDHSNPGSWSVLPGLTL